MGLIRSGYAAMQAVKMVESALTPERITITGDITYDLLGTKTFAGISFYKWQYGIIHPSVIYTIRLSGGIGETIHQTEVGDDVFRIPTGGDLPEETGKKVVFIYYKHLTVQS